MSGIIGRIRGIFATPEKTPKDEMKDVILFYGDKLMENSVVPTDFDNAVIFSLSTLARKPGELISWVDLGKGGSLDTAWEALERNENMDPEALAFERALKLEVLKQYYLNNYVQDAIDGTNRDCSLLDLVEILRNKYAPTVSQRDVIDAISAAENANKQNKKGTRSI